MVVVSSSGSGPRERGRGRPGRGGKAVADAERDVDHASIRQDRPLGRTDADQRERILPRRLRGGAIAMAMAAESRQTEHRYRTNEASGQHGRASVGKSALSI